MTNPNSPTPLFRCSCPCLDCIGGLHCGGTYILDSEIGDSKAGDLIGICHYPPPEPVEWEYSLEDYTGYDDDE